MNRHISVTHLMKPKPTIKVNTHDSLILISISTLSPRYPVRQIWYSCQSYVKDEVVASLIAEHNGKTNIFNKRHHRMYYLMVSF